ncbi:MAG: DUF423 domain-containing protein [Sphingomonadales bacterium]|nr:DUF423 domain-containing protein [Sphingomonadales bacterium]
MTNSPNWQPQYRLTALGALLLAAGIALGAFGAHGLKDLATARYIAVFETGVQYQVYTALGIMILSLFGKAMEKPILLILAGMWIFSVSLYFIGLNEVLATSLKKLGAITPIGGVLMIAGWCWAGMKLLRLSKS